MTAQQMREAPMLTGQQARDACSLLRWTRYELNRRTALPLWIADRVFTTQGDLDVTPEEVTILSDAFDRAGVEFMAEGVDNPCARLRKPPPATRTF